GGIPRHTSIARAHRRAPALARIPDRGPRPWALYAFGLPVRHSAGAPELTGPADGDGLLRAADSHGARHGADSRGAHLLSLGTPVRCSSQSVGHADLLALGQGHAPGRVLLCDGSLR